MGSAIGTVASLHRYPVKSMQGEELDAVTVDEDGMRGDRTWALRDTETGKLVSAKRPRLWRSALDCYASGTGDEVEVTLPSGDVHGVRDPGLLVALADLFERPVAVEPATHAQQGTYESDWPELDGISLAGSIEFPTNLTGEGTTFVDLGILHVLTTSSMTTLQASAPEGSIDVRRFRPSMVVDTPDLDGYPENEWAGRTVRIGEVEITMGDPAPRCVMTTVAQPGLPREPAVLQTIAAENRLTNSLGSFACLGCYATVTRPGTIRRGDPVISA